MSEPPVENRSLSAQTQRSVTRETEAISRDGFFRAAHVAIATDNISL